MRNSITPRGNGPIARLLQRGIGLIEASLFVVISLGMIASGVVLFQHTSEAARVNEAIKAIVSLQSGVRSLYVAEASFGSSGANLAEAAIASGAVTPDMVGPNGTILNQWGGPVSVTGHPNTFVVDYRGIPQSACVRLAPHSQGGTGPAGNGIAGLAINGVLVDENGDGLVSPTEAETACALSAGGAAPLQMKWAFMADVNMRTGAWEVEEALDIDPVETGRDHEAEDRACGAGFLGNESRSRDHVTLSDGSVQPTEWSAWDRSGCTEIVETARRTENQSGTCPAGMSGSSARSREIITMSDGTEQTGPWTEWDTSACHIIEVSRRTETENGTCPTGLVGTATRNRDVAVMSDGSEQPQAWSIWDNSACLVVEVSRRTESQNGTCPTGLVGTATRTREVAVMSDGTEQPQSWSSWNNSQCLVVEVSQRTETENGACPAGFLGTATRTRTVLVMSNGTEQAQAWSAWNNASCAVGEVSTRTDTETATCDSGFTGNKSRSRTVKVMSDGTEQPQAWSAWNTSSCAAVNVVVATRTYKIETLENCGAGRYLTRQQNQTRQLWSNGAVTYGAITNASLNMLPGVDSDLWGGEVILAGGGGGGSHYVCFAGTGAYYRDVREYYDCGSFGQQAYNLRHYYISGGSVSSNIISSGACGYY